MLYRDVFIEKGKTLDDSGVLTIDLDVADPISVLHLLVSNVNGATSNLDNPIVRNITKIEVVDGSDVLFSMDGRLAQALAYYWSKIYPDHAWQEYGGAEQYDVIPIFFGRHLWDPDYALVPANFKNLQMKITYNFAAVNSIGATGYLTGQGSLSLISRVMEKMEGTPTAFFMHKNHYSFTTAASGDERVDLPTDWPYAMLMLRAWESGTGINSSVTNAKMSIDQDKIIPFDHSLGYQMRLLSEIYPKIVHGIRMLASDGDTRQTWLAQQERAVAVSEVGSKIVGLTNVMNSQLEFSVYTDAGAADTTDRMMQVIVEGYSPFNCVAFPFGILEDPATYLNAPEHSSVKLYITQGNAGAEADIVISQLRKYE
jgi:hypothetical protein